MPVLNLPIWPRRTLRIHFAWLPDGVHLWLTVRTSSVSRAQLRPVHLYRGRDGMDVRPVLPQRGLFVDETPQRAVTGGGLAVVDGVVIDIDREIEECRSGVTLPGMGVSR